MPPTPLKFLIIAGARLNFMKIAPLIKAAQNHNAAQTGERLLDFGIRFAHVEAGLRSFDRTMPEEINRLETDSLADLLLTTSEDANENHRCEGIPQAKIKLVGNVMIDSLIESHPRARQSSILQKLQLGPGWFVFVTLHRPGNVDQRESLSAIMNELQKLARQMLVIFPIHPRTRKMLIDFGIRFTGIAGFHIIKPIGYHDYLCLTEATRLVLTGSGGLQEESTYFKTPCLTLRLNTERPVTLTVGSNKLTSVERLSRDLEAGLACAPRLGRLPPFLGRTCRRTRNPGPHVKANGARRWCADTQMPFKFKGEPRHLSPSNT